MRKPLLGLTVRTEEAVLYQGATAIIPTDMESLAVCVLISIVTLYLLVTVEPSIGGSDEYLVKKYFNEKYFSIEMKNILVLK